MIIVSVPTWMSTACCWITRDFETHHAALAVRHFGTDAHTGSNIEAAVNQIVAKYGFNMEDWKTHLQPKIRVQMLSQL